MDDVKLLVSALTEALQGVPTRPEDSVAVALAHRYAEQIDVDPSALVKVGPLLLGVLVELGMTPRARASVLGKGGGGSDSAQRSALDELRERRRIRQHHAEVVDPASP